MSSLDALRPVDQARFRAAFGRVAAPVAVVTSMDAGRPHGTTVSAFCAQSLDPPLVLVSLDRGSELLRVVGASRQVGINVLGHDQHELALAFARKGPDKFRAVAWIARNGVPRLEHAHAWIAGRVQQLVPCGDHTIVVGLVVDADGPSAGGAAPLVYHERRFDTLRRGDPGP